MTAIRTGLLSTTSNNQSNPHDICPAALSLSQLAPAFMGPDTDDDYETFDKWFSTIAGSKAESNLGAKAHVAAAYCAIANLSDIALSNAKEDFINEVRANGLGALFHLVEYLTSSYEDRSPILQDLVSGYSSPEELRNFIYAERFGLERTSPPPLKSTSPRADRKIRALNFIIEREKANDGSEPGYPGAETWDDAYTQVIIETMLHDGDKSIRHTKLRLFLVSCVLNSASAVSDVPEGSNIERLVSAAQIACARIAANLTRSEADCIAGDIEPMRDYALDPKRKNDFFQYEAQALQELTTATDPVFAVLKARKEVTNNPPPLNDAEEEASDIQIGVAVDGMMAAKPQTLEGAAALLDWFVEYEGEVAEYINDHETFNVVKNVSGFLNMLTGGQTLASHEPSAIEIASVEAFKTLIEWNADGAISDVERDVFADRHSKYCDIMRNDPIQSDADATALATYLSNRADRFGIEDIADETAIALKVACWYAGNRTPLSEQTVTETAELMAAE